MPNLIQCLDCEKDISPSAEFCPHCGCPKDAQLEAILNFAPTVGDLFFGERQQWMWKEGWVKCYAKDGTLKGILF